MTCSLPCYTIYFYPRLSPFPHPFYFFFFFTFIRRQNLNYTCNYFHSAEQRCTSEIWKQTGFLCLEKSSFFFFFPSDFHTCSVRHKSNEAGVCLTVFQLWLVFLSPEICTIFSFSSHLGFCFSALQAVSCKIDVKKVALEVFWGISCPQRKSAQTKQKEGSHLCINKVWLLVWKTSFLSVSYSYWLKCQKFGLMGGSSISRWDLLWKLVCMPGTESFEGVHTDPAVSPVSVCFTPMGACASHHSFTFCEDLFLTCIFLTSSVWRDLQRFR